MTANKLGESKHKYGYLDLLFLILFVITAYFTRNTICQIMMMTFCMAVGLNLLMKPRMKIFSLYFVVNILFILYGALNAANGWAISASVANTMVRSLGLNLIMVYAIVQYILWKKDLNSLMALVEWGIFIVSVIVLVMSMSTLTSGRLGTDTEVNANMLAMLAAYGMIICMYLVKNGSMRGLSGLKMLFYLFIVLFTGSRKGLLMIALAVMIINFINGRKKLVRNIFIVGISLVCVYYAIMEIEVLYDIVGHRVDDLLSLIFEEKTTDYSLINRQQLIETGWEYINKNPWKGYGYDCFKIISGISGSERAFDLYSHNNYVELLFGGGIIAFVLYYIPVLWLLIGLVRNIKSDPCITYALAILVVKLSVEYAYVSYYSRIDAYVMAILVGCLLFCKNKKELSEGN